MRAWRADPVVPSTVANYASHAKRWWRTRQTYCHTSVEMMNQRMAVRRYAIFGLGPVAGAPRRSCCSMRFSTPAFGARSPICCAAGRTSRAGRQFVGLSATISEGAAASLSTSTAAWSGNHTGRGPHVE